MTAHEPPPSEPLPATQPSAPPGRRPRWPLVAALGLLLALAGWGGWGLLHRPGRPARWRIANRLLIVEDARGRRLFARDLGAGLPGVRAHDVLQSEIHQQVRFADLDGDGRLEVLVKVMPGSSPRERAELLVLDAQGRERFSVRPSASRHFGRVLYGPTWFPHVIAPLERPDGSRALWVSFIHNTWFPSFVLQLDARGQPLAEYWSNGHVLFVGESRFAGRDVLLVGATNNEARAASLALLDRDHVAGSSPAASPAYACSDCAAGRPREFLLFPSSCLWRRQGGAAAVTRAFVDGEGRLHVVVLGGGSPRRIGGRVLPATVSYVFDAALRLEAVRVDEAFLAEHARLASEGGLDHRLGPADEQLLQPVRRWDGSRFVDLPAVPLTRGPAADAASSAR